jgi:hypothetical protein
MPSLLLSINMVAQRQSFYRASPDIYGSFLKIRTMILLAYDKT